MDTTPIERIIQPPTNKIDQEIQAQKILEVAFYDAKEDDKNNPMSEININQNAAHNSDEDTPEEEEDIQVNMSIPRINISTPPFNGDFGDFHGDFGYSGDPNSPDTDPGQHIVRQSRIVLPLGPIRTKPSPQKKTKVPNQHTQQTETTFPRLHRI